MNKEYFDTYESKLEQELLKLARSFGQLDDQLLASEDIDQKWKEIAPDYLAEAVKQIADYPEFSIGCAAFVGMGIAKWWDEDWGKYHGKPFTSLLGSRGFDNMDDHIMETILGFTPDSAEGGVLSKILLTLSQTAISAIRKEKVEFQSTEMYHILARTATVLFKIGAAIQLKKLGYKFHKVNLKQHIS